MKKKKKKRSKVIIIAIVSSVCAAMAIGLIITNIFIPVKYLPSYCVAEQSKTEGVMRVSFVDVGYGDCTIVELPDGKSMLIDAGDGSYSSNLTVLKELNRRGIDEIDYLVCTSVNNEHCAGFSEILKYKQFKNVFMPYCINKYITEGFLAFSQAIEGRAESVIYSEYGAGVTADGYFFKFLSPSVKELEDGEYAKLNSDPKASARDNASAVMWLEYSDTAIMFTGDVRSETLEFICNSYLIDTQYYPVDLKKCRIVQMPNHGNGYSASALFYETIKPVTAVLSVGENASGCPSVNALTDALNFVGDRLYRTDERGTITVEITLTGYTVKEV